MESMHTMFNYIIYSIFIQSVWLNSIDVKHYQSKVTHCEVYFKSFDIAHNYDHFSYIRYAKFANR